MRRYWALVIVTFVGCSSNDVQPENEFDAALTLWQERAPLHYSYTYQKGCFCIIDVTRKVRLEVDRYDTVVSGTYLDSGEAISPEILSTYPTIAALFGEIAAAQAANYFRVEAEYDPEYGFPSLIYLDQEEMIVDEEVTHWASDLTPLPSPYSR